MQRNPLLQSINSGEFSPKMEARVDFDRYPNAAKRLRNCLLFPQGGFTRRSGSRFVSEVKDSTAISRLYPFQYSQEISYQIEAANQAMRFFRRQSRIEVDLTNAAITNGTFDAGITGWTDVSSGPTYPQVEETAKSKSTAGSVTATVSLPGAAAGDLLIFSISVGAGGGVAPTITTPAGWTQLFHVAIGTTGRVAAYYKTASGSEGSSVAVTLSTADNNWAASARSIQGVQGSVEAATATGTSATPDPPALTPSWGSATNLWIALEGSVESTSSTGPTVYPTGYGDIIDSTNNRTHKPLVASCDLASTAASENPDAFTLPQSRSWVAATIAIRPAATAPLWDGVNGRMELPPVTGGSSGAEQSVAISGAYQNSEHVLKFRVGGVGGATIKLRVGTTSGGNDLIDDRELGPGEHSQGFTPGASPFYVRFINEGTARAFIDNVGFLSGEPMSLVSPYVTDDWTDLKVFQGQNFLWLLHPEHAVRTLTRFGHRSWSLTDVFFEDGPYDDKNDGFDVSTRQLIKNPLFENGMDGWTDASNTTNPPAYLDYSDDTHLITLNPGGNGGIAKLRTSVSVEADVLHVLHFLLVGSTGGSTPLSLKLGTSAGDSTYLSATFTPGWHSIPVTPSAARLHIEFSYSGDSRGEEAVGGVLLYPQTARLLQPNALTGNSVTVSALGFAPFKSTDVGCILRLTWPGREPGYAAITAFISSSQVTVQVVRRFGDTAPTEDWRFGSWCEQKGHPVALAKFDGRTVFLGSDDKPGGLWASQSAAPLNMRPDTWRDGGTTVEDDDAIVRTLDSDQIDPIHWGNGKQQLVIGTAGGQWIINSAGAVITPADMSAKQHSSIAGSSIKSLAVEEITIFADRTGRQLFEIGFNFNDNSFVSNDLTILAEHILKSPVAELAYQRRPFSVVWARREDGRLAALSYNRQHEVLGWSTHILGGAFDGGQAVVESISVIPGAADADQFYDSDERDELWMIVKRTVDGVTKRYIEFFEVAFEGPLREDYDGSTAEKDWRNAVLEAQKDAFYLDCGLSYVGAAATVVTGATHLANMEVGVLADGKYIGKQTVTAAGHITLAKAAEKVHLGLLYKHSYESLKLAYGAAYLSTAVGKVKAVTGVGLVVLDCAEFKVTTVEYDEVSGRRVHDLYDVGFARDRDDPNLPVPLFTGETGMNTESAGSSDPRIYLESETPLPCSILGLAPEIDTVEEHPARR